MKIDVKDTSLCQNSWFWHKLVSLTSIFMFGIDA